MVPQTYPISSIPDLPIDQDLQLIKHIFRTWPQWTPEEEESLHLTEIELSTMRDPAYGSDLRQLTQNDVCPCFLHSYSTVFQGCPCGCRQHPFSTHRLLRDGVRGFFLISMLTGKARWVHPRGAALLCGLNPQMKLPKDPRAALCLIGQCASPLQAAWIGAHLIDALNGTSGTPGMANTLYKMWLLRQAHGMYPKRITQPLQIVDESEGVPFEVKLKHHTKVGELLSAEERLHGEGCLRGLCDLYGRLHDDYDITHGAIVGDLVLQHRVKKQRKAQDLQLVYVTVQDHSGNNLFAAEVSSGTQVFEIMQKVPNLPRIYHKEIMDDDGNSWRLDERIRVPVNFVKYRFAQDLFGAGHMGTARTGLGSGCIDKTARRMLADVGALRSSTWIPAVQLTWMLHDPEDTMVNHWLVAALHGVLRGCVVVQDHWLLLEMAAKGNLLYVACWDGQDHCHRHQIMKFAEVARQKLVLRTLVVTFNAVYSQEATDTCGTVALLHLGHIIGYWKGKETPSEAELHLMLMARNEGELVACGRPDEEEQLIVAQIREILVQRGVPEEKTEERAHMALKKIGMKPIATALKAKNPWASLKAAGSQPKVNFLWIKPDELEKQIKLRAQSKFRASVSERKKETASASTSRTPMDPRALSLIPNTFITEDGRDIQQIEMEMVAADKTGLAFGSLADVAPFLKEDKSITMDALAIITTSPVPPASQGLMPVSNLRYPALYNPTQEAVLIEGSIVQLGDCSILRRQDDSVAAAEPVQTKTFKFVIWKDEWPGKWDELIAAPVKKLMERWPRLLLCKGDRCGPECRRFHSPVDCDLDQVVVDLWGRGWYSCKGKRVTPQEADQFQVLMRIPLICADGLQQRSGQDGVYVEPRREDGKSAADEYMVIWLNNQDKNEASHRLKVCDGGVALARFGFRYGIRVFTKDAEALHKELYPEQPFQNIHVHSVYELRPLPYGLQTAGVRELLRQWGWKAKVLQPFKADQHGQGWLVGAEAPPPTTVFQTTTGDVLVTLHKKPDLDKKVASVLSSAKTKTHLRKGPAQSQSAPVMDKENLFNSRSPHPQRLLLVPSCAFQNKSLI